LIRPYRNITIVIPAHEQSKRLPGKVLLDKTGKTLLQHTYEAARQSKLATRVLIAAGSDAVAIAAMEFRAPHVLVAGDYPNGTRRVIAAVAKLLHPPDIVVNLQADEPEITGEALDALIRRAMMLPRLGIATLVCPLAAGVYDEPDTVKVAVGSTDWAMYFSRAPIAGAMQHVGAYVFRPDALKAIRRMSDSRLAQAEDLEQLQWLDHGLQIAVERIDDCLRSINILRDYERFCSKAQ